MFCSPGKDSALFVYLAWGTRKGDPTLSSDDIRQAAYHAITTRSRTQFCHILAIGGTAGRVHLIAQFPPSLSISDVARIAQEAGSAAVAHQSETFHGRFVRREQLWESGYTVHTMGETDAAEAQDYLSRQMTAEHTPRFKNLQLNFL